MEFMKRILNSGYTTLVATVLAVAAGLLFPEFGGFFKPFSDLFLTLISISVIPIIFASVTCSIVRLMTEKSQGVNISSILFSFIFALALSAIIGIVFSLVLNPSASIQSSPVISDMIFEDMTKSIVELDFSESLESVDKFKVNDIVSVLLPSNPFAAFANGNVIQILAISILVGISIATFNEARRKYSMESLNLLLDSFKNILKIPTKVLPIGIFFLIASSLCDVSVDLCLAMKDFCISALLSFSAIILISLIFIKIYSPIKIWESIQALKAPITIAFSTRSNQATLPFLMSALQEKFGLDKSAVELSIPMGTTMCRTSNACYYAFVTVFITSLYNTPLSIIQYCFVIGGAILVSLAASGASGIIAISMISIILDPLNVPLDSILPVLIIVEPVTEPFRAVTNLIANAALSCVVINKKEKRIGGKECA